jgi:hypothetical protein
MVSPCHSAVAQKIALVVPSGSEVDELLARVLANEGWSIQTVVDNREALSLARHGNGVEGCDMGGLLPRFHIQFLANSPDEFWFPAFCGKHSTQKQETAGLDGFNVGSEWLGRIREVNAELLQTLVGP